MKKFNYIKNACLLTFGVLSLNACMEEELPTQGTIITSQAQQQESTTTNLVWGMPSKLNSVWSSDRHYSWGYGAVMQIRDQFTQDLCEGGDIGYTWWNYWAENLYQGDAYIFGQFMWNHYMADILATNELLRNVDPENASDAQKGMYATGLAQRAMLYLDLARMYEYLPTDGTEPINADGHDVSGLTLPITSHKTTADEACNNPRATHADMLAFIEADLDEAEEYISLLTPEFRVTKTLADLACVYGLKARLYMWDGNYEKAAEYARKAIDESGLSPMSKEQCLNTTTGFNDISCWMWGAQQNSESSTVKTGILNWTSWLSNQTEFGYTGSGTGMYVSIDRSVYERISDTDFRKLMWIAPEGSPLRGQNTYPDAMPAESREGIEKVPYASTKFRPNAGNVSDYSIGAASAYPLMRVEEMYFIEAEAIAHTDAAAGLAKLKDFMLTYRDPSYICAKSTTDAVVEEIVFQKRIELWGEGQTFFDIKRLDYPVVRGYAGTNHAPQECLNTTRRPAWMNLVMVQTESNNNKAVFGWNNPDPSGVYPVWSE